MNIYVGNLSFEASEETLRQAFEPYGEVSAATIIKDKYSGQSRGFGFVEMPDRSQAQAAIENLNDKELLGRKITVNEAHARSDRGRSGGQGQRRGRSGSGGGDRNRY